MELGHDSHRVEFVQYAVPMLWAFHEYSSRYLEGADLLEIALACLNEQPPSDTVDRGRVLTQVSLAWLYIRLGRLNEAEDCSRKRWPGTNGWAFAGAGHRDRSACGAGHFGLHSRRLSHDDPAGRRSGAAQRAVRSSLESTLCLLSADAGSGSAGRL